MASSPAKEVIKQVRPLLSTNSLEAKRRVLKLYKEWCRSIEHLNTSYQVPLSYDEATKRIKNEFMKHKDIKDIRVIDMMVLKSQKELYDIKQRFFATCQFYYKFKENEPPPADESKDFLKKFLAGAD